MVSHSNSSGRENHVFDQEIQSELAGKKTGSRIKLHFVIILLQKHFQCILG